MLCYAILSYPILSYLNLILVQNFGDDVIEAKKKRKEDRKSSLCSAGEQAGRGEGEGFDTAYTKRSNFNE